MSPTPPPDELRRRLLQLRRTTLRRAGGLSTDLESIVVAATDVATDDEHDPEGHTIAWERQQLAGLLTESNAAIERIDAALVRLSDGRYGRCVACDAPIPSARLEALPATPTCVACANRG